VLHDNEIQQPCYIYTFHTTSYMTDAASITQKHHAEHNQQHVSKVNSKTYSCLETSPSKLQRKSSRDSTVQFHATRKFCVKIWCSTGHNLTDKCQISHQNKPHANIFLFQGSDCPLITTPSNQSMQKCTNFHSFSRPRLQCIKLKMLPRALSSNILRVEI